jgi:DNA-directed RNA polymerase specialized sigma24 family protein
LATVAVHEAFKLIRRGDREPSLDAALDGSADPASRSIASGPVELAEQRERLAALAFLPERQQRFLWLQALGLSYDEMAAYESCTPRTVERQLLHARTKLRLVEASAK